MAKSIEPQLKNIGDYLKLSKKENFLIPEYQRAYSWNIEQCDKLLQDIEDFGSSDPDDPYFFGSIIIDCSDPNRFSLIDGQQRTTTFLLLIKAILIRLNEVLLIIPKDEDSEDLISGLTDRRKIIMGILYKAEAEDIPSMLKDHTKTQNILILENKSINESYRQEFINIINADNFEKAEGNAYKKSYKQKDNRYTNYFRNFKYFYNKLTKKSDTQLNVFTKIFLKECQVIEIRSWQIEQAITMFNSLNSTGLPLSDADIISAKLYSYASDRREDFNKRWEGILNQTKKLDSQKIANIDSILQQFMYITRAINKEYEKSGYVDVTTPGLRRYYADREKELLQDALLLCHKLEKIIENWNKVKEYPVVKLLLKCNVNVRLFLSSYLYRYALKDITNKEILLICECLLKLFILLEVENLGYSSVKFKTFLFAENIKLVNPNITINEIYKDFCEHIHENWNVNDIKESILFYNKNLLVFVNEYLYSKDNKLEFNFSDSVNIEHIMPASGRNVSIIRQDAGMDQNEFKEAVDKVGNKILLEDDINQSIGNEWFKTKKQTSIHNKSGYKDSKYPIAQSLINYHKDTWTKKDIDRATEKVAQRLINFIFS
ncbi:DNAse/DNA nickase specific for phosphorothioated or glycosylated phage DNA [Commensalibacter communis]|uniref:DUF262 domain-containing protein n=1 Tax=Commensalibacter communis TaxID=2972786 RepID=UPI0022FFA049|nr:DUF262 domain-containing HNH endonuclease family protein [Commensalibacter communis]CAI3937060.1 DNAse/DNA nickase specific for phosphorothioated or glycosylated phage DNA [Commensalibacter communis]CAI3938265.1 DNAse/DNA nickase specific for phosphorothioated or glycosylated phage DNA [Commensalibacter communis]